MGADTMSTPTPDAETLLQIERLFASFRDEMLRAIAHPRGGELYAGVKIEKGRIVRTWVEPPWIYPDLDNRTQPAVIFSPRAPTARSGEGPGEKT